MGKHLKIIFILLTLYLVGATVFFVFDNWRENLIKDIEVQAAPTEYTEEQTQYNTSCELHHGDSPNWPNRTYAGQKVTITKRKLSQLGFVLSRNGSTDYQFRFYILKASDKSVLWESPAQQYLSVGTSPDWYDVAISPELDIYNEEVLLLVHPISSYTGKYISLHYQNSDVKASENYIEEFDGWNEYAYDAAYRYTYTEPTEYTEKQTKHNTDMVIASDWRTKVGQKLSISNRRVTKLAFILRKEGSPAENVTFEIRRVSDDSLICSKVWGAANDLPTENDWVEVEFDTPQTINEEVRILVDYPGADGTNRVILRYQNTDVKADECETDNTGGWQDRTDYDAAYRYTFTEPLPEYTEEQTEYNTDTYLNPPYYQAAGQRLTIANRRVTKLAFVLYRVGSPSGDVTFSVRKIDNTVIQSKVWGAAADLPLSATWKEVEFDTPQVINEEVRILIEFTGGDASNYIKYSYQNTDVKADEWRTYMGTGGWGDMRDATTNDTAYRYTYEPVEQQTQGENYWMLEHRYATKVGQRLNISNRIVTKLGFWLELFGSPTEDLTFEIRRTSDDTVISSKVWGNASELSTTTAYEEVEFADPQLINEEVRIVASIAETTDNNGALIYRQNADVKENELYTEYLSPDWTDNSGYDCAYRYTYILPEISSPTVTTTPATAVEKTTATLNGEITDDGGEACEYRFEYDIDSGEPYASSTGWTGSVTTSQSFSEDISGLLKGTLYYFRAQ
ncbi:MAG: hypothetical protein E3J36_01335, partial [Candidatus Nealsonbacteria bacterium]